MPHQPPPGPLAPHVKDDPVPPPCVGSKFHRDGSVRRYPGNTVLMHLAPGPVHDALTAAQDALRRADAAGCWSWLPPASFHMTLFDGLIHAEIGPGNRFAALDPGLPGAAVDTWFVERLAGFDPGIAPPYRLIPAALEVHASGGVWLRLGAGAEEEARLRRLRDALADRLGLRRASHDAYRFHITLAYLTRWPDAAAAAAMTGAVAQADAAFRGAVAEIVLGAAEVCLFDDMHAFRGQSLLGPA